MDSLTLRAETLLPEALRLLRGLVEINSFTANAAGVNLVAEMTAEMFAELGFGAEVSPGATDGRGTQGVRRRRGSGGGAGVGVGAGGRG
ncbi:MAG: hypothetical protein ACK5TH_10380, partial [Prosthecobacter sp.]